MRKEKLIIILLALAMCTIVGKETYAYYISNMKVNIISTSSEVICDAEITEVPNAEKTKLGYSEFKVIVKNHDSSNNIIINANFIFILSTISLLPSFNLFEHNLILLYS